MEPPLTRTSRKILHATDRDRAIAKDLQSLANIGPAMAEDLMRLGVETPSDLAGSNADDLYARLCALDGKRHDPCVLDTFMAAVDEANGHPARPWWTYTAERKQQQAAGLARRPRLAEHNAVATDAASDAMGPAR